MQTNPAVEQNKTLNDPRVRGISPVGKEKKSMDRGKDLPIAKSLVQNERLNE